MFFHYYVFRHDLKSFNSMLAIVQRMYPSVMCSIMSNIYVLLFNVSFHSTMQQYWIQYFFSPCLQSTISIRAAYLWSWDFFSIFLYLYFLFSQTLYFGVLKRIYTLITHDPINNYRLPIWYIYIYIYIDKSLLSPILKWCPMWGRNIKRVRIVTRNENCTCEGRKKIERVRYEGRKDVQTTHPNNRAVREQNVSGEGEGITWTGYEQSPAEQRDRASSAEATTT